MRTHAVQTLLTAALVLTAPAAELKAELVSTAVVWDAAPRNMDTDLVRFKDRWFLACCESADRYSNDAVVRVLTSADGAKWESAAVILSPTAGRGLRDPKFAVAPDGRLLLSADGIVPTPTAADPLPRFGGTVKTMAWYSKDGRVWTAADDFGAHNYPLGRAAWHKNIQYGLATGCICGIATTVQFQSNADGKGFHRVYEETFSDFPLATSFLFEGDAVHCIMSRGSREGSNTIIPASYGTAKAPFKQWEWTELDVRLSYPNLTRLPDGRAIAAVGLHDPAPRTALCGFDSATGKLKEFFKLPVPGPVQEVGIAAHDGHIWVSYHETVKGKPAVHVAKVKLN